MELVPESIAPAPESIALEEMTPEIVSRRRSIASEMTPEVTTTEVANTPRAPAKLRETYAANTKLKRANTSMGALPRTGRAAHAATYVMRGSQLRNVKKKNAAECCLQPHSAMQNAKFTSPPKITASEKDRTH